MSQEEKRFMTVTDLAKRLGLSTDTLYRMERRDQLPKRVKIGPRWMWWRPSIDAWERERLTQAGIKP